MSQARPRRVVPVLAVLCVALAVTIYRELTRPIIGAVPAASRHLAAQAAARTPTFTMPPVDAYADVVARPLFSPTRRPPLKAAPGRTSDFRLVGTIISATGRDALLAHGAPPKVTQISQGGSLAGWTVKAIEADHVILVQDGRMAVVAISAKQPVAVVTTPAARYKSWPTND